MKFASQSVTTAKLASRQTLKKKPKLEQLDSVLFKWFSAVRSEGKPVTGPMIVEKAKKFGQDLGVAESESNQNSAEKYKDEFEKIVADNDLTPEQIYNADETGLLWRCLPTSTLAGGGENAAKGFKKNKDRLTVLLCANASGNHRVTPFVIDWFFHHFVPEVKESFKSLGLPEDTKAILLLDNCKAHLPVDERSFIQGLLNADCDVTDFQKKFTVKDAVYSLQMFNIFVNDIPEAPNVDLALYADDTAIISQHPNTATVPYERLSINVFKKIPSIGNPVLHSLPIYHLGIASSRRRPTATLESAYNALSFPKRRCYGDEAPRSYHSTRSLNPPLPPPERIPGLSALLRVTLFVP
ncbi:jerky protein homolog [Stegodyphus dumicola]|uniref:jerky protein homolog n=1 Tax=Stegodyphus dumicola TaxID=202533 RepID=UPI0015A82A03|nr:jerky protein homolog [Stegodyphus dumicola]